MENIIKVKLCPKCGGPRSSTSSYCKPCTREYNKKLYLIHGPKRKEALRKARETDPERFKGYWNKKNAKIRAEMIAAYGGVCECCGESEEAFLTLEHKNRDGAAHRKSLSRSRNPRMVYADLKRRGWPKDGYGILCFNCNTASWKLGTCPHKLKK